MKRLFLLCSIICLSLISIAQEPEKDYVTDTNFEKIFDKYTAQINEGITNLAEKLEGPALQGWEIIVKQQVIIGISVISVLLTGLILIFAGYRVDKMWKDYEDFAGFLYVIGFIVAIIGVIFIFTITIPRCVNPEYYAIKQIFFFIA